jgi:hypothetical protein
VSAFLLLEAALLALAIALYRFCIRRRIRP